MNEEEIEDMFAAAIADFPPGHQETATRWFEKTVLLSKAMSKLLTEQGLTIEQFM